MKAKVTGVSAWQATPTSGTLDISIPQRYVDSDGNATVRHYSGVLRIDGAGARWMNALNPDEDLWLVVQGPTDPGGPLATFNEILSYGAGSDVRTSFTRRLVSSDLNGLFFDYAQPAPVNPAGFGIEPLTMQGARALLAEGTSIFGEMGVVLGELADLQTDTAQSQATNQAAIDAALVGLGSIPVAFSNVTLTPNAQGALMEVAPGAVQQASIRTVTRLFSGRSLTYSVLEVG